MTLNEFNSISVENLRVRSGFNGKILTSNFNPNRHSETLGKREVIDITAEMVLNKKGECDIAYPVICCWVDGREEYLKKYEEAK